MLFYHMKIYLYIHICGYSLLYISTYAILSHNEKREKGKYEKRVLERDRERKWDRDRSPLLVPALISWSDVNPWVAGAHSTHPPCLSSHPFKLSLFLTTDRARLHCLRPDNFLVSHYLTASLQATMILFYIDR